MARRGLVVSLGSLLSLFSEVRAGAAALQGPVTPAALDMARDPISRALGPRFGRRPGQLGETFLLQVTKAEYLVYYVHLRVERLFVVAKAVSPSCLAPRSPPQDVTPLAPVRSVSTRAFSHHTAATTTFPLSNLGPSVQIVPSLSLHLFGVRNTSSSSSFTMRPGKFLTPPTAVPPLCRQYEGRSPSGVGR